MDLQQARRDKRNLALREARLKLLKHLQDTVVEAASPDDAVSARFSGEIVRRLRVSGAVTLGDLQARIRRGGRWWRGIPAIGRSKAALIPALSDLGCFARATVGGERAATFLGSPAAPIRNNHLALCVSKLSTAAGDRSHDGHRA